jgi:hypothetical protein
LLAGVKGQVYVAGVGERVEGSVVVFVLKGMASAVLIKAIKCVGF